MLKLIKELKPFVIPILLIIVLLFLQAATELALPDYMSDIVNVGIQQSGIEKTVPKVMKADTMSKVKMFVSEDERSLIDNSYKLINSGNLTENEYKNLLKKYPALKSESLYILNTDSKEDMEKLDSCLGNALFIVKNMEERVRGNTFNANEINLNETNVLKSQADGMIKAIPESIVKQSAIEYIKSQYEDIGIDIGKVQTNYILYVGGIMLLISLTGMAATISVGFISARISSAFGRNLRDKILIR